MRSILFITFAISCLIGSNLALPTKRADKPVEKIGHLAEKVDNKVNHEVSQIKRDLPLVGDIPDLAGGNLGLIGSESTDKQAPKQSQTDAHTDASSDQGPLKKRGSTGPLDALPGSSLTGGIPVVGDVAKGGLPGTNPLAGLPIAGAGSKGGLPAVGGLVDSLPSPLSSLGGSGGDAEEPAPESPPAKKPTSKPSASQNAATKAHGAGKDATADTIDNASPAK